MPLISRLLDTISFVAGPGAGTTAYNLGIVDLSHARELMLEVILTKAQSDAGDTLRIKFQDCSYLTAADTPIWNTRARLPDILGNIVSGGGNAPSTTAPIIRRMALQQVNDAAATEKSYIPTGSADGADLAAGSTVGGPFPGKITDSTARRVPTWRWALEVLGDMNSDADFEGILKVYAVSEYAR